MSSVCKFMPEVSHKNQNLAQKSVLRKMDIYVVSPVSEFLLSRRSRLG